jgi:hypothetical protein
MPVADDDEPMSISELQTHRWHLGIVEHPRVEHLVAPGQVTDGGWALARCGAVVAAEPILRPVARDRCQACLAWLRSH